MATAISGIRVKFGKTEGDVRVKSGGKLVALGVIVGTLTVESGGFADIIGVVGGLVVEPGARAKLRGLCTGDVINHGGDFTISGTVHGALSGGSTTPVMPRAKIGAYNEPNADDEPVRAPLPQTADLANTVIDDLTNARWAEVRARFDARMRDHLSEEELAAPWAQIPGAVGNYQSHGDIEVARAGDITRTNTLLRFDAGELVARITFRDDQTIAGLYMLNPDVAGKI